MKVNDSLVAGSISGVVTRLVTNPFDVLKVRLQLQIEPTCQRTDAAKYKGVSHAARLILKEEGVLAFWKGVLAGQILYAIFNGTQFTVYETSSRWMLRLSGGNTTTTAKTAVDFTSGCTAGAAATLISFPFDVLRTRMISQGEPKMYTSLYRGVTMMYYENGFRTFYRGLTPALISVAPQSGLHFSIFKLLCRLWDSSKTLAKISRRGESMKWLLCGAMAGATSKFIMLPLDMVKKRLEVQGFEEAREKFGRFHRYSGSVQCFVSIYKHEGYLGFYKGAYPAILKAMIGIGISFSVYERILGQLKQLRTHLS